MKSKLTVLALLLSSLFAASAFAGADSNGLGGDDGKGPPTPRSEQAVK